MTSIEFLIVLLLLFMTVPDFCRFLRRPALIYPAFVIFGFGLGPLVNSNVGTMIQQAGQIGFLLLLFEVGMEIELPKASLLARPLAFTLRWAFGQYPVIFGLARFAGLPWLESFVAAAALTGCSVGMTYSAWKHHDGLEGDTRAFVLRVMVLLEMLAILLLAIETPVLAGDPWWLVALKLAGAVAAVYIVSRIAAHVVTWCQFVLETATKWRIHIVILVVLAVCAVGERLGLSGPKTAFFLGLFMGRVHHDGRALEHYLAPVSQRFLIPIFFVALGMQIPMPLLLSVTALQALTAAALIFVWREMVHRRWLPTGGSPGTCLLLSPNLTIVALAASAMLQSGRPVAAAWLLFTGLFVSVTAILVLPPPERLPAESTAPFAMLPRAPKAE